MHRVFCHKRLSGALFVFFVFFSLFFSGLAAADQLMVAPTRVVIEGRASEEFIVINTTDGFVNYRVGVQHYTPKPDGTVELTDKITKRQLLAQKMIRFSPRKSTLPPRGKQVVRALAHPVPNLPDGEYRLHLRFEPLAKDTPRSVEESQSSGTSIKITLMIAIAVPVFYRHGDTYLDMTIGDQFSLVKNEIQNDGRVTYSANVQLLRKGNRSGFGDVVIMHKAPGVEGWTTIGGLKGVPVYIPAPEITRGIPLDLPPGVDVRSLKGQIMVQYRDREKNSRKVLAERVFNL